MTTADINSYLNDDWNGNGISELVSDRKKQKEDFSLINPPDVIITDHNGNIIENPSQISFKTEFVSKIKKDKKEIYVCGLASEGQLGLGNTNYRNFPTKIEVNLDLKLVHNLIQTKVNFYFKHLTH